MPRQFGAIGFAALLASVTCVGASADPLGSQHVVRASARGTSVTMHFTLHPSIHPQDDEPYFSSGSVTITQGSSQLSRSFSFASLGLLTKNELAPYVLASGDPRDVCGASAPIEMKPITHTIAPVVVIATILEGKGCYPLPRYFVPTSANVEAPYAAMPMYSIGEDRERYDTLRDLTAARVVRVRHFGASDIAPADRFGGRSWETGVVDVVERAGKREALLVNVLGSGSLPVAGDSVRLYGSGYNSFGGVMLVSKADAAR